jgi:hypothetical protein
MRIPLALHTLQFEHLSLGEQQPVLFHQGNDNAKVAYPA